MAISPPHAYRSGAQSPFASHFPILCSLLIMVALFTSVSEVVQLFSGSLVATVQVVSQLRLLREGVYLILLMDFALCSITAVSAPLMNRLAVLAVCVAMLVITMAVLRGIALDLPFLVIVSGTRFLEYVPLALMSAVVYADAGHAPFVRVGRWVFIFLIIETIFAVVETRLPFPLFGRTFIGTRAFGTFVHPNIFGATVALCYMFLRITLSRRWQGLLFVICLFDVLASGSRAGMLGMLATVGVLLYCRVVNPWSRLALALGGILASPAILVLGSNSALTGRQTGIESGGGFERLDVWSRTLSNIHSIYDLVLGWGIGLGSNTVFTIYGYTGQANTYISDNSFFFLLGSYGAVGVLVAIAVLLIIFFKLRRDEIGLAFFALWLLQLLVSQAMETYPENVMAMIILGWRLAICARANKSQCPVQASPA